MAPAISVVVPVYNRTDELRRALESLRRQSFDDFECIVVDDASTAAIEPIVDEFRDVRFVYVRNTRNGGPYNARVLGYRRMTGEFLVGVDSDCELYPWTLERAVCHLADVPGVDGVAGLYLRADSGRVYVRLKSGRVVLTPDGYARQPAIPECLAVVRRHVVEEWLAKRDDYFALEFHQWFTFYLRHSMLFVDEPWAKVNLGGRDRVSLAVGGRRLDDYVKFLEEHHEHVGSAKSPVLDRVLEDAWFHLIRAGRRRDAARFAEVLAARGLSRRRAVTRRVARKARAIIARKVPPLVEL